MLFVSVITKYPEIITVNKLASAEIRKNFAITTKLDSRIKKIIILKPVSYTHLRAHET
mgnify:CR=1 FL=1